MAVFNDNPKGKKPRLKLGYGTANKARRSVALLKAYKDKQYKSQMAHTMYYRAKYHAHQTKGMRNAMKIYGRFIKTLKHIKGTKTE